MELTFKINGEDFPVPELATLTLDEWKVFYEHSNMTVAEVAELDGDYPPGVLAGLLHLAVARAKPQLSKKQILREVGSVNMLELLKAFEVDADEGDALPPPSEPEDSSSSNDPSVSSGPTSNGTGELSPESIPLVSTGNRGSDTTAT